MTIFARLFGTMPTLYGETVIGDSLSSALRRHERLHAVPMIVYTARDLDDAHRGRLRLGASTEFLTKGRISPLDFER